MTTRQDATVPLRTYLEAPSRPALRLPAGACDAHVHVFGPPEQFPYAAGRSWTPVAAGKEALFALHRSLGIARCVVVQSLVHGLDNRVVEDTIAAGGGRYLGVALVRPDVDDAELARLAAAGMRGVRFHFSSQLGSQHTPEQVAQLTPRLAPHGLHLQLHFEPHWLHAIGDLVANAPVPVVIDHMGRVDARLGPGHVDVRALMALLRHPHVWVKVSGIDRVDAAAPPAERYRHGVALARELVLRHGERCVWGTDWPHPNHTHIPDDGHLVDALAEIAPSAAELQALLVDNPQRLYRFGG